MKLYLKMLAVSVAAVIIAVGGYRLFFYRAADTGITVSAPAYDGADRISAIQRELIRAGFYDGDADGVPDEELFASVSRFREENGLSPSERMSPEMLFMLGITLSEDEVSEYESDRLIASAVDAVCGDAGYLVKIALAGVILKRAASPGFPDNAAGVIFGCRQFSDVYLHDFSAEPSDDAFSAVRDAKLGMSPCPEALYFYQSDRADAALRRKSVIFRSGKYCFA